MNGEDYEPLTTNIPADVDMPDKVLATLTARQVLILGGTALLTVWLYLFTSELIPPALLAVLVLPLLAAGGALALGRRDGLDLDRLLRFAAEHLLRRKELVAAPEGVEQPPAWCGLRGRLPSPLRLPVRRIRRDGVMELAGGGAAAIVRAGTISFGLRTTAEQASLVALLGRWLNSLDAPVQILIQTRCADLSGLAAQVAGAADPLLHPALQKAARGHADFLDELSRSRELLAREVLVVVADRQPTGDRRKPGSLDRRAKARDASAAVVLRRAEEAVRALTAMGVAAELLDAGACAEVLTDALSGGEHRPGDAADPDEPITSVLFQDEEESR